MPNPNYVAGRAFEYERAKWWREQDYEVLRTAGSHGIFDLVAINFNQPREVVLIQCKLCSTAYEAQRLIERFLADPPMRVCQSYVQAIETRVKGSKEVTTTYAYN